ncbi:DNA pilot protein [Microviridae sp.]|nr:DNA pilot protein [Microviridae sp.]
MAFIEAGINAASQQATNAWSAKEAQKQRDWQEEMSNTSHQREVDDLKAAGLNPILSVTGGSGASSPVGAKPDLKAGTPGTDLMQFANSAADTKNKKSQNDVIAAQERQIAEQTHVAAETARLTGAKADSQEMDNAVQAEIKPVKVQGIQAVKNVIGQAVGHIQEGNSAAAPPPPDISVKNTPTSRPTTILGNKMNDGHFAKPIGGGLYKNSFSGKIYSSDGNLLKPHQVSQLKKHGVL